MKIHFLAAGLMGGLAAAAIAAAPLAAAGPITTSGDRVTMNDKRGHNANIVQPPNVGSNSYGSSSSPLPLIFLN